MMRVLRAEEALQSVTIYAAGGGLIKTGERTRILNRWRREARMADGGPPKPRTLAEVAGGLPVVIVSANMESNG